MARIILVTGGARSGKSTYAEKLMLKEDRKVVYVATCPNIDSELNERIDKHQQRRAGYSWETIEEESNIQQVIKTQSESSFLVECLTLWISNLMYAAEQDGKELSEEQILDLCNDLVSACDNCEGTVLFVSNETGMGIMPMNKAARKFGDLAGRCNQIIAAAASEVHLLVSGIPLKIKG